MAQPSICIPQEIIDTIIKNIDVQDKSLLRNCALVSHSSLYQSRKQLYSYIKLSTSKQCRSLCNVLLQHPYIQSLVKTLDIMFTIEHHSLHHRPTVTTILRLLMCSLSTLLFSSYDEYYWYCLPDNLKYALSDIIHSSSLTTFTLSHACFVPTQFFLGLKGLRTLCLYNVHLSDVGIKHEVPQTGVNELRESPDHDSDSPPPIEHFTWCQHRL
jgi:hypothetical protein